MFEIWLKILKLESQTVIIQRFTKVKYFTIFILQFGIISADLKKKEKFFEGDIRKSELVNAIIQGKLTGQKREIKDAVKWPSTIDKDGSTIVVVPIEISDDLKEKARTAIAEAILDYNQNTCIRLVERKNEEKDYVKFVQSTGYVTTGI